MFLPRYLVQNPSGYYFRIMIPKHLRPLYGRTVVKRSLRTTDHTTAQSWALVLADRYAHAFQRASRAMTDKTLEDLIASAENAMQGYGKQYEISERRGTFTIKTNGTEQDHLQAMQALQLIQQSKMALPSTDDIEAIAPTGLKRITLKKAIEEYKERIQPNPKDKAKLKTFNGAISKALSDFEDWAGSKTVVFKITRNDLSQFATKTLQTGLAKSTVRDKLSYITGFFNFAQSSQYYAKGDNPAMGHVTITKRDKKTSAKRGWQSFSHEQLTTIFTTENFQMLTRDSTRWIAILLAYTGARPNEIAQLDIEDFKQVGNTHCIEITELGDGKRVKTSATERIFPIHNELIQLGLLDKISAMKMKGETRLFPELNRETQNGPSSSAGKDFTKYLKQIEVVARGEGIVGIRSFRPSFITEMAEAGVAQGWRELFVGHEQSEGTQATDHAQRYTKTQLVGVLAEKCLPAVSWSEKGIINIEELKRLLP